jgi:hypothetical protein
MSLLQGKAIVSHLKDLMTACARRIAAELVATGGGGRLPTNAQLMKMGPRSPYTRGSPQRHGW